MFINDVINGDCMAILPRIADKSIDMVLTDIPYGVVNRNSAGIRSFDKKSADVVTFDLGVMVEQICRITKGSIYIFCSTEQVSDLRRLMVDNKMTTRLLIWNKTNPSPVNGQYLWLSSVECCVFGRFSKAVFNEHCKGGVMSFPSGRSKMHPTEKPLGLFEYIIKTSSNAGDIILDPFAGSGTTGVACKKTGRGFLLIEKDEAYIPTINSRLLNTQAKL